MITKRIKKRSFFLFLILGCFISMSYLSNDAAPPKIIIKPEKVQGDEGITIQLFYKVDSYIEPYDMQLFEGKRITYNEKVDRDNSNVQYRYGIIRRYDNGYTYSFYINQAYEEDSGQYEFRFTNELGSCSGVSIVHINSL